MAKAGRPKSIRPHEIKLMLPKVPLKYKAKRLYWALLQYEKNMSRDITSVKMSEYTTLLDEYIAVVEQLAKQGIKYTYGKQTFDGVDEGGLDQSDTVSRGTQGTSENGQAGVGTGIRTINPIT